MVALRVRSDGDCDDAGRRPCRASGLLRELSRARTYLALAAVHGPTPVETALGRCRDILEEAADDKVLEAAIGYAMAFGEAMRGRFDEARELAGRSSAIYEEFGRRFALAAWSSWPGAVELLAGEPEAAERIFRSGFDTLSSLGGKSTCRRLRPRWQSRSISRGETRRPSTSRS